MAKRTFNDFNDDLYCQTIEKWENEDLPRILSTKRWGFIIQLLVPFVVVAVAWARIDLSRWAVMLLFGYVLILVLNMFEELNENLRFVRHQPRAYRDAVREVRAYMESFNNPDNLTLPDVLRTLDSEWLP